MLSKSTKRGRCPFRSFKECDTECVFYRKGVRYLETENRVEPFEDCAINVIADSVENQVQRTFGLQKEFARTAKASTYQTMAIISNVLPEETQRQIQQKLCEIIEKKVVGWPDGS